MKISTGLYPTATLQHLPVREGVRVDREDYGVTIPVPNTVVRDVWILSFQEHDPDSEKPWGQVVETMLSATEPVVVKQYFALGIVDEHPHKQEMLEYELKRYNAPDDVVHTLRHSERDLYTEHRFTWWEVTI